jgi:hypothetical protein
LKVVIRRGADRFHDEKNCVVGQQAGEGVGSDGGFALKHGTPKDPRDEKRHGTEEGSQKVVPAVCELALKANREDGRKCGEGGDHERRRR